MDMTTCLITKEVQFDAGHRVPWHKSKCRRVHGHRYRVVAHVVGPVHEEQGESDEGMVMDFGDVKELLVKEIHDKYDHKFILYEGDVDLMHAFGIQEETRVGDGARVWVFTSQFGIVVVPCIPTAENLAKLFYNDLATALELPTRLHAIEVWETPTSMARYPE